MLAAVAILSTPVYRGNAVLRAANVDRSILGNFGSGLGSASGPTNIAGSIDEAIAIVRSQQFAKGIIIANNLMPGLFPNRWNDRSRTWNTNTRLKGQPTRARAFRKFDDNIRTVTAHMKTGLMTISIDWKDWTMAAS